MAEKAAAEKALAEKAAAEKALADKAAAEKAAAEAEMANAEKEAAWYNEASQASGSGSSAGVEVKQEAKDASEEPELLNTRNVCKVLGLYSFGF